MEILREGGDSDLPLIYDMACFRQFGGCSTFFRFGDHHTQRREFKTRNYHGDDFDNVELFVTCPKCSCKIVLLPAMKSIIEFCAYENAMFYKLK